MLDAVRAVFSVWPAGRGMGPSRLLHYTLGFVTHGEAVYEIGEPPARTVVSRGHLVWMPRGTLRHMTALSQVHLHSLQLDTTEGHVGHLVPELPGELFNRHEIVQVNNPSHVEGLFKAVERHWVQRAPYGALEARGIVLQILAQMLRTRFEFNVPPHLEVRCDAVIEYLAENYTRPDLELEDLAAVVGWSKGYLTSTFRRMTGETPMAYVRRLRINLSLDLLATGSLSVAEVGEAVGFADPAYFSRVFSRQMGRPPSAYLGVSSPGSAPG